MKSTAIKWTRVYLDHFGSKFPLPNPTPNIILSKTRQGTELKPSDSQSCGLTSWVIMHLIDRFLIWTNLFGRVLILWRQ